MRFASFAVALLLLSSCGASEPSRTEALCDRFRTAVLELDDTQPVLAEMLDLGTENNPQGIEGAVYLEAMLLAQAMQAGDFIDIDFHTRFLLDACKQAVA